MANSCADVTAPIPLSFFTAIVSLILALVTIPGNLIVCIAVLKDPLKSLKTPFTFFVVNLAVADLVVGVVTEPLSVLTHFREGFSLEVRHYVVPIHMSYFISCTASVLNLAALTADRFVAISYPLQYRVRFTTTRATVIAGLIWLVSFSLPLIYFEVGYLRYAFVFANTAVALTLVIFLFTYVRTVRAMRAQVSQWDGMRQSSQSEDNRARIRAASVEKNITQAFMVMLGFFLCCYIPSCIIIYMMNFCSSCNCTTIHVFRDLQFIFVLSSSALNPFVYAWRLPNFRTAFKKILRSRKIHDTATSSSRQENRAQTPRTLEFS
ncbi:PREDICTED: octopamine receptor-like [Acropora digitifera]|uniref:octopamine receptor-like n=1 Tax=Acropora digitifera TaxID=70779 RepID=UPI00077ACDFE|nr:PREDICTED: octopamine receptor-like [Acropora digitifera]